MGPTKVFQITKRSLSAFAIMVLAATLLAGQARANSFSFDFSLIPSTNENPDIASQLSGTVWDKDQAAANLGGLTIGDGNVLFTFDNDVDIGYAADVTEIYFDDGLMSDGTDSVLNQLIAVYNSPDFPSSPGDAGLTTFRDDGSVSPPDLPGGDSITPKFNVTLGLASDSDNPGPSADDGLNASNERVGIEFSLLGDTTIGDFEELISVGILRIGFHIRSIDGRGSDAYITGPPPEPPEPGPGVVPEPATMLLLGTGLMGIAGITRRKKRISKK